MSVNKESFRDWKSNPVTKAVFNELYNRILAVREDLGNTAGIDPLEDRRKTGAIAAYGDMINVEYDEVSNGN
jgi:hypothetical protein